MSLNSFDRVVQQYERTKPMISKHHSRECDVRPIGARNRKWERIKRINEHTYALCDGYYGNCIYGKPVDAAVDTYENLMAPITWMRREGGDFIRIRNHNVNNYGTGRYDFFRAYLPIGMDFYLGNNAKHELRVATSRNEHGIKQHTMFMLPKTMINYDWGLKRLTPEDGVYLLFRVNKDGTFTRVGDLITATSTRINKEAKLELKPQIDAFYAYCGALAPMLNISWEAVIEYQKQINDYMGGQGRWIRRTTNLDPEVVREIITNEDHALRVALAAFVVRDIDGKRPIETKEDMNRVKAAYNRLMNQALNLHATELV